MNFFLEFSVTMKGKGYVYAVFFCFVSINNSFMPLNDHKRKLYHQKNQLCLVEMQEPYFSRYTGSLLRKEQEQEEM